MGVIRQKIISGILPGDPPKEGFATMGAGRMCRGCDLPIKAHETQMAIELRDGRSVVLHRPCYAVWLELCDHH